MKLKLLFALLAYSALTFGAVPSAQERYIEKYKDIAIKEMQEYGIPASITLAQGILESGSGESHLAKKANNHFGIKCHEGWKGKKIYHDDDEKNECFRRYKKVEESYRDHSLFLKNRSRYASLFEEDPTDYKAWAKGLKKAGYATNRKYDDLLIGIIERYGLHQYDLPGYLPKEPGDPVVTNSRDLGVSDNFIDFIIVQEGESWKDLEGVTKIKTRVLLKYNDLETAVDPEPGQIIYTQPKRNKSAPGLKAYEVQQGDSMHSISQKFGIKLHKLYQRNQMEPGSQAAVGTIIKLR